ncbi:MAG: hypothetical protein ABH840_01115 [Nanoarchaeota archaeon]
MKRGLIIANLIVAILIVFVLFFYSFSGITGRIIFTPSIPSSCSDAAIQSTWDSIFKESSSGIIIASNTTQSGKCEGYMALKNFSTVTYLLAGQDKNIKEVVALKANLSQEMVTELYNNISQNLLDWNSPANLALTTLFMTNYANQREPAIAENAMANAFYQNVFKMDAGTWQFNPTLKYFYFNSSSPGYSGAILYQEKDLDSIYYTNFTFSCTPNWTAHNTSCLASERLTQYLTDSNSCNQVKENETHQCDFDSNGIIGNLTNLTSRTGLSLYSNSSLLNISTNYSRKYQLVQFKSGSNTVVEFNWNFSQPLNLDDINIEKQSSSDTKGYILVKGIPANKKVFVNRIANYSSVCVRNSEIDSIDTLTSSCSSSSELIIQCPGTVSGISCAISGNFFQVEGLTSSAVREFSSTNNCVQNWNCTSWGVCISRVQTRTCTDRNNCNNLTGKPATNQSCVIAPPPCTSNWNCSDWTPEKCPRNQTQTRTCNDKNLCNPTNSTKTETKDCEYDSQSMIFLILIIVVTSISLLVLISIILLLANKKFGRSTPKEKPVTQYGFSTSSGY